MSLTEAIGASIRIKPKALIPIHCFEADPLEFQEQVERRSSIEVAVLHIGEIYHLQ